MHAASCGRGERVEDRVVVAPEHREREPIASRVDDVQDRRTSLLGRQNEALHGIGGHGRYRTLFLAFFHATDFTPAAPVNCALSSSSDTRLSRAT